MAKKISLDEKLEKLSSKKEEDKSKPILAPKKVDEVGKPKIDEKLSTLVAEKIAPDETSPPPEKEAPTLKPPVEEKPISPPAKEEGAPSPPPDLDTMVSKSDIDDMVSKIERDLDLKLPRTEKADEKTIMNFEIPSTGEIKDIMGLAAVLDESGEKRLTQLLYLKDEPEAEPQWTVIRDSSAEEFAMIVKEGLKQFKTKPLVYGMEFEDGVILASHRDGFTITLACYELKINKMLQVFISIMEYIERRR